MGTGEPVSTLKIKRRMSNERAERRTEAGEMEEWLREQVEGGWFDRGRGEKGKSWLREHGRSERWLHGEFNEEKCGQQYVGCTEKTGTSTQNNTLLVLCVCVCVCLRLSWTRQGVNTATDPGHLIQIRR